MNRVQTFALPDVLATQAGGTDWVTATEINRTVFAARNGANVEACLRAHDANDDWAIGVLSTESILTQINGPGSVGPGSFRYAGINRANPDLLSVASGNYELWTDNTWNTVGVLAGTPGAISSFVVGNFGALVPTANISLRHVTGDGGLLSPP